MDAENADNEIAGAESASIARRSGESTVLKSKLLDAAARDGNEIEVRRLLSHENGMGASVGDVSEALMSAAAHGHLAVVNLLLEAGADVEFRGPNGFSSLDWASLGLKDECVERLLAAGSLATCLDVDGQTALIKVIRGFEMYPYAFYEGKRCAQLLIDAGCDVEARDKHGQSALNYALGKRLPSIEALIRTVMERDALAKDAVSSRSGPAKAKV